MDVFAFRQRVMADYERFSRSFSRIRADDIAQFLDAAYQAEHFWPAPLVQLNPDFVPGGTIEDLVDAGLLHAECRRIFRAQKTPQDIGKALRLHQHQEDAIHAAQRGRELCADDRHRLRQIPRLLYPHRPRCPAPPQSGGPLPGHQRDRHLSDERAVQ